MRGDGEVDAVVGVKQRRTLHLRQRDEFRRLYLHGAACRLGAGRDVERVQRMDGRGVDVGLRDDVEAAVGDDRRAHDA